jgi:hypothetical protein
MVVTYRIVSYDKDLILSFRKGPNESEEGHIDKPSNIDEFSTLGGFITYKGLLHALMEDMKKQKEPIEIQYDKYLNTTFEGFSHAPIDSLVNLVNELISLRNPR